MQVSAPESRRNLRRSFRLTQLKRSSLHLEKRLVSQRIQEHRISLQALNERMLDIETNIAKVTLATGELHCYMDEVGISIPDTPDHVVSSIMYSEVTFSLFFMMHTSPTPCWQNPDILDSDFHVHTISKDEDEATFREENEVVHG